jgi:hypothetical protein
LPNGGTKTGIKLKVEAVIPNAKQEDFTCLGVHQLIQGMFGYFSARTKV